MNLKKKDRVIRKLAGWLLSLLVLVVVTIAFFFIMIEKSSILEEAFKHYHSDPVRYQS